MKNNTCKLKRDLEQALRNTPNDFALLEVKQHIKAAINKINEIENKREKRETLKEKREKKLKLQSKSIYIIEKMIEEEKKKLDDTTSEIILE